MTYPVGDMPQRDPGGRRVREGTGGVSWPWVFVAILAIVIVLLVGWWLWQGGNDSLSQTRSTSLGAILEEPVAPDDRVVVSGRVERLLTENAMTLSNDFVDDELLILMPPGAYLGLAGGAAAPGGVAAPAGGVAGPVAPFLEGQFVQITGSVRTFDSETMATDYGLVLAPELFEPFEGAPTVITEVFDIAMQAPQIAVPVEEDVNAEAVLAEPEAYAGQAVRVEGGLGQVLSDNVFTLSGPGGESGLLVVGEDTGRFDEVEPGRTVRVEGTVLSFDADALAQAGVTLGDDLDTSALEGRPAIMATTVDIPEPEETDEAEPDASPDADASPASAEGTPAGATTTPAPAVN